MADAPGRGRPRLRTILLLVNLLILLVPLALVAVLRLYESELVRGTEAQLLVQGALLRESFRQELGAAPPVGPLDEAALRASLPRLDIRAERILPPAAPAGPPASPAEERAQAAGERLTQVLRAAARETLSGIRLVDRNGVVVASSGDETGLSLAHREEVAAALAGRRTSLLRRRVSDEPTPALESLSRGQRYRVFVALPVEADGRVLGAVVLSRTPLDISKALWLNRRPLLVAAAIVLAVAVGVSLLVSLAVARPLGALMRQARRAEAGERGALQEIARPGIAEIAELSSALASMARVLETRGAYIRTFAGHVSHEFKTPLTTIRGAVELLLDHEAAMTPEQRRDFIARIAESGRRLEHLVGRLLDLARADVAKPTGGSSDALAVSRSVAARFTETGFPVAVTGAGAAIAIDEPVLDGILSSLLDNSRFHGAGRGSIALTREDGSVVLGVSDDGPGITEANAAKLFTPFFTTARERGGSGLGLAIARALVEAHGGTLELVAPGPAPVFRVIFPPEEPPWGTSRPREKPALNARRP